MIDKRANSSWNPPKNQRYPETALHSSCRAGLGRRVPQGRVSSSSIGDCRKCLWSATNRNNIPSDIDGMALRGLPCIG